MFIPRLLVVACLINPHIQIQKHGCLRRLSKPPRTLQENKSMQSSKGTIISPRAWSIFDIYTRLQVSQLGQQRRASLICKEQGQGGKSKREAWRSDVCTSIERRTAGEALVTGRDEGKVSTHRGRAEAETLGRSAASRSPQLHYSWLPCATCSLKHCRI